MIRLIKSWFKKSTYHLLPPLQNTLTSRYDPALATDDELLLMMSGHVKDPAEARRLMAEYGIYNAPQLLPLLPVRKVDWQRRVRNWIMFLEGSQATNPYLDRRRPENLNRY